MNDITNNTDLSLEQLTGVAGGFRELDAPAKTVIWALIRWFKSKGMTLEDSVAYYRSLPNTTASEKFVKAGEDMIIQFWDEVS